MTKYTLPNGDEIRAGELYKTRDGRKAFVCWIGSAPNGNTIVYGIIVDSVLTRGWFVDGRFRSDELDTELDLISLWPKEPIEVTDDMVVSFLKMWFRNNLSWGCDNQYKSFVKECLEAAFTHIAPSSKEITHSNSTQVEDIIEQVDTTTTQLLEMNEMIEQATKDCDNIRKIMDDKDYKIAGLEAELDILVNDVLNCTDLKHLQGVTRKNFPSHNAIKECPGCKVNLWQDVCECPIPAEQTLLEYALAANLEHKGHKINLNELSVQDITKLISKYLQTQGIGRD